ncbi:MAG TPA: DUF3566 domain-containing protein [Longimicrobiales bacterium]
MTHRIRKIGVLKAGILGAAIYALLSLLFVPFFLFFVLMAPVSEGYGPMPGEWMMSGAFVLLMPFLYAIFGFIGTALAALIYNLVAAMMGGLEIELQPIGAGAPDAGRPTIY